MNSPKKHKIDIFKTLDRISSKDTDWYQTLTEEHTKDVVPFVLMRWLTGTKSARQLVFINELVNPFVFSLSQHKTLLVYLMMICCPGKPQRYYWNKAATKRSSKMPVTISVVREYFRYNSREAEDALPNLTTEDVIDLAEQLGRQPDDLKAIKKELKARA